MNPGQRLTQDTGPFSPRRSAMEKRALVSGKCNKSAGAPSAGFPVRLGGVNQLHAAFLIEGCTRDHGRAVGNPGSFVLFAKGGIPRISMHTVAYPTLEPNKRVQGWAARCFVVLTTVTE